uniref:Si:ch211-215p11.1 n=1 Tax=Lepisosteus oculatus TaxID=7918 RepID=W5LX17_LEPOC
KRVKETHKEKMKKKYENTSEGQQGKKVFLNDIYTDLCIIKGESGEVNEEHEVRHIEKTVKKTTSKLSTIRNNDLFKSTHKDENCTKTVLTKGVAGIGKTVSVEKFILDWADGTANEDIDFIFIFLFRELNLMKENNYSLLELIYHYYPEVKEISDIASGTYKILFIFDGLDESRLDLDFQNTLPWQDVKKRLSLNVLLPNIIKRNLLSSALIWITSRPAAASQIPPAYVDQVTEVRGFNDQQKEDYFRKRFTNETQAHFIITYIKSKRSLYIMCHIPVFCWISATVLENASKENEEVTNVPRTLTEMYTRFMLHQIKHKKDIYLGKSTNSKEFQSQFIQKLGQLAFEHLEKNSLLFYEEDLKKCDIDISQASVYSGVCTEIFTQDSKLSDNKVFSFVHLTIQEYLAALYVFLSNRNNNINPLDHSFGSKFKWKCQKRGLYELNKSAVDKALQSKNGHLDLFLRFLLGLSVDSNLSQLQDLLTQPKSSSKSTEKTANYIKKLIRKCPSPERCINLFHCLNELNDNSLVDEIKSFLSSGSVSRGELSLEQCSALAYFFMISEEIDEFDLKKYSTKKEMHLRLLPVVKYTRRALLERCNLNKDICEILSSALRSNTSDLIELDLSNNNLEDSGGNLLSAGLKDQNCKLEKLRLERCNLTKGCCEALALALSINSSHLKELDLSNNNLEDSGMKMLCDALANPYCKLEKLSLENCNFTKDICSDLASALHLGHSKMREMELRDNCLEDSGVNLLCTGISKIERLGLSFCGVTERGCEALASVLRSNSSKLRELNLSYNHPGDSGLKLLSALLEDPNCELKKLHIDHVGKHRLRPKPQKYACQLTLDPNTAHRQLILSEGNRKVEWVKKKQLYPDHTERFDHWTQVLCREDLSGTRCYWEAEWSGDRAVIAVTYKGIDRKGESDNCYLGHNDKSWSLECSDVSYSARHGTTKIAIPVPSSHRVGVYLDWPAGSLSFFSVSTDTVTLLHTFNTTFSEPLYSGFWVYTHGSSVSLCELE